MNEIAIELNETIKNNSEIFYFMLSDFGRKIYMPKGIISQTAEAKKHAKKYNATIGEAKEHGKPMYLKSLFKYFNILTPDQVFPYASPYGLPELRALWRDKIIKENPLLKSTDAVSLPVTTQALTNGLMLVGDLFINEGDEILVPDKLWGNYRLIFEVRYKGKIVTYSFFNDELTGFNTDALDQAIAHSKQEKIVLLLNFPNNPTGYNLKKDEVDKIVQIVKKHAENGKKILVVSDDAYYGLNYSDDLVDGSVFSRFVTLHPNVASVKIDGFTKEYYVWGFRVGFMTFGDYENKREAYEALEKKTAGAIRSSISNCSNTKQSMLLMTLRDSGDFLREREEKFNILKERAEKVTEVVYDKKYSDCWDVYPFNSGYFMCLRLKGVDAEKVRTHALMDYGVGAISIGKTDLRIAFSCIDLEEIEDIFEIVAKSIRDLQE